MSKLNERLTLVASLSVVVGIVFLAVEMRLNTEAIQAQTRDAITEKQMTYSEWIATSPETADVFCEGESGSFRPRCGSGASDVFAACSGNLQGMGKLALPV